MASKIQEMQQKFLERAGNNAVEYEEREEIDFNNFVPSKVLKTATSTKKKITMSNAIVNATQLLNLSERRIIFFAIAQNVKQTFRIDATTYSEMFGVKLNNAYEQLKEAGEKIFQREIVIKDENKTFKYRWVQSAGYHDSEGWLELTLTNDIYMNLRSINTGFTTYSLVQAGNLKSVYSWRLLERFMQYGDNKNDFSGWYETSIEDFTAWLGLSDYYLLWANLRVKILEPSIKELKQKDNWNIELIPKKKNRKIVGFRVEFRRDSQTCLDL